MCFLKLITEFEDYHTQQLNKKKTIKEVVNKLIHQIETRPDREALKADLKQNQAYNPFVEKSKNMIHSMENVEYFENVWDFSNISVP